MRFACPSQLPDRQRGAATLFVALVALLLLTLVTLYSTRHSLFEQRTSANQFHYGKAFEAAQGGIDYAIAWLGVRDNVHGNSGVYLRCASESGATWVADGSVTPFTEKYTLIPTQDIDGYKVNLTLRRDCSTTNPRRERLVEITSAVSTDDSEGAATVRQIVDVNALRLNPTPAPLTLRGCLTGVTGTPQIQPNAANVAIYADQSFSSCIDTGHLDLNHGTVNYYPNTWAWDQGFPYLSKSDVLALAKAQTGGPTAGPIYYYQSSSECCSGNNWTPPTSPLGDAEHNVIVVFDFGSAQAGDSCPTPTGNTTIYGIVYCKVGGNMNGWGNVTIYGALIVDSSISQLTANTAIVQSNTNVGNPIDYTVDPVLSKVTGSWRDW